MPNRKSESSDASSRRRGRPIGKNRVPLSLEERRARNAQYERERRSETSDAMAQLAEAAGCDISISNAELLATVVSQLQRAAKRDPSDDIETLRRCNENYMQEITELEERLGWSEDKEAEKENLYRNTKAFKKRNVRSNIKQEHNSDEELKVDALKPSSQQAFEMKLCSDNSESINLKNHSSENADQWTGVESLLDFTSECYEMIEQWETEPLSLPPLANICRNLSYQHLEPH